MKGRFDRKSDWFRELLKQAGESRDSFEPLPREGILREWEGALGETSDGAEGGDEERGELAPL